DEIAAQPIAIDGEAAEQRLLVFAEHVLEQVAATFANAVEHGIDGALIDVAEVLAECAANPGHSRGWVAAVEDGGEPAIEAAAQPNTARDGALAGGARSLQQPAENQHALLGGEREVVLGQDWRQPRAQLQTTDDLLLADRVAATVQPAAQH